MRHWRMPPARARGRSVPRRISIAVSVETGQPRPGKMSEDFLVRFWGVRGSIPCPGPETVRYGGNTSCVEMRCGEHLLIFDGGTGLRELGNALKQQNAKIDADLFYT